MPHAGNPYTGKFDALTDCWHDFGMELLSIQSITQVL